MTTYLALGSNLGERLENLQQAREKLLPLAVGPITSAPVYETAPLDCPPGSPPFLNTVLSFETSLSPSDLLAKTQAIESECGRAAKENRALNAPRPIDIDLLFVGTIVLVTPTLTLPHPRLHERLFVLYPLCDLAATVTPPTHSSPVSVLRERCPSPERPPVRYQKEW